jgi:transketolase
MSPQILSPEPKIVARIGNGIRRRVLEHTLVHNGGYLSQACSSAEVFATLYSGLMNLGPSEAPAVPLPFAGVPGAKNKEAFTGAAYNGPKSPEFDRFIMSPVHYAVVLYAALVEVGRMAPEGLAQFNQDGSTVEMIGAEHSPGHEVTAGSLGQALSQAGGIALARRLRGDTGRVWVFMSDGEFQSGQTWETLQALRFHKIDNIVAIVDVNQQQCDGAMKDVMAIEPLLDRISSFGIAAVKIDGHDIGALSQSTQQSHRDTPLVVLAYTNPCQGVLLLEERRPKLHYLRFKNALEKAKYQAFLEQQIKSGLW